MEIVTHCTQITSWNLWSQDIIIGVIVEHTRCSHRERIQVVLRISNPQLSIDNIDKKVSILCKSLVSTR